MSFSDLNDDVLDCVLRLLPDFDTLTTAIRSSKRLYNVFNAHPTTIKRYIAGSLCGHPDALPAAVRLVRLVLKGQYNSDPEDGEDDEPADVAPPQPVREENILDTAITRAEAELLGRYGNVVRSLEDLYSWRYRSSYGDRKQIH